MNKYCLGLLIYVFSQPVLAWGPLGHQVICDMAWRGSSKPIQKHLAAAAKRMGYRTFADSCLWADDVRGQEAYHFLSRLHYMNVDKKARSVDASECLQSTSQQPECVLTAIGYYRTQLADRAISQRRRDEALLLVGHFVGDIHQPLHVSYKDDRGGTLRRVIFSSGAFKGRILSLHRLWDTEILFCDRMRPPSWRKWGKLLFQQNYPLVSQDQRQQPVQQWAEESFTLTRRVYQDIDASGPSYRLPANYCDHYQNIAIERLPLAATRLADLLASELAP